MLSPGIHYSVRFDNDLAVSKSDMIASWLHRDSDSHSADWKIGIAVGSAHYLAHEMHGCS